ncbi:2-hydroxyacid dehydrogenase [Pararhizobium mangrovi]|uniref:Glyoxylate/hydroxypyruvate reductase A n=1 Tax=Pararhizobium mangrovi TaxID=2590452 RepID=A0A506UH91_9HYPH|nr:glyoxylate/hydroxypyruvate reductase A [Pararhizobium mangrovi]TPW32678.1 glyoxylate/hydroxypyruvate reductase A [Pararhizobium mangrovi]
MTEKGTVLLSITGFPADDWMAALTAAAPDRRIVSEPDGPEDASIRYAVVWKPEPDVLSRLPNLQAIFSVGAGVDHVFAAGEPPAVPIVRAVSWDLTMRMSEYVVWRVLDHHRSGAAYRQRQANRIWEEELNQPAASDVTVGIMGLGELGTDAAGKLANLGFRVTGWSRSAKTVDNVTCHHGEDGLKTFLSDLDILVVLLPLTKATRHIVDGDLFAKMKERGPLGAPILINAGRGGLQDEAAILTALDAGRLGAASLDVFETEPLPANSPLWSHPKVTVTPHAAAISVPAELVPPMVRQMDAHEAGEPLSDTVDPTRRY